jgi:hypothetical protein
MVTIHHWREMVLRSYATIQATVTTVCKDNKRVRKRPHRGLTQFVRSSCSSMGGQDPGPGVTLGLGHVVLISALACIETIQKHPLSTPCAGL